MRITITQLEDAQGTKNRMSRASKDVKMSEGYDF
jgi:hypothetical protein